MCFANAYKSKSKKTHATIYYSSFEHVRFAKYFKAGEYFRFYFLQRGAGGRAIKKDNARYIFFLAKQNKSHIQALLQRMVLLNGLVTLHCRLVIIGLMTFTTGLYRVGLDLFGSWQY